MTEPPPDRSWVHTIDVRCTEGRHWHGLRRCYGRVDGGDGRLPRGWLCGSKLERMVDEGRKAARDGDKDEAIRWFRNAAVEAERVADWLGHG